MNAKDTGTYKKEGGGEESDTAAGVENIESSSTAGQMETEALTETPEALADLETEIDSILSQTDGIWSIYVKNLETGESLSMNNQRMYAASLIKLFVMEAMIEQSDNESYNDLVRLESDADSFGEETDYILCIMSSECSDQSQAISVIQTISQTVYEYLNP